MDWARDYRGNIVQAKKGAYSFGMVCPTCGEAVHLRQGGERRPHFAHFSNRAKPDCENYHPPQAVIQPPGMRAPKKDENTALSPRRDSLRCNLFITHRPELDAFELSLRIPALSPLERISGSIEIQSGLGYKSIPSTRLASAVSVRLAPQVPLIRCTGTGLLLPLANHLLAQSRSFTHGINLFSRSDSGGRFMFPGEPLEWGGHYWVVADSVVVPPDEVLSLIVWTPQGLLDDWPVYELELPEKLLASRPETESLLAKFFGRLLRPMRPRAYIVHPSPHHLAGDGAYVYPGPPPSLHVRRTAKQEVSVEGTSGLGAAIQVAELSDEWVEVKGLLHSDQDTVILLNGIEQVLVRIEDCAFFRPTGIRVFADDQSWDLLDASPLSETELYLQEVRVECSRPRLASHLVRLNENWQLNGTEVKQQADIDKTVLAGGFGAIRFEKPPLPAGQSPENESTPEGKRTARGVWVAGLVGSEYGQHAAQLVREYLANPSLTNLQRLGPVVTSPLMAYVRSALLN
jgi:hypothetical protein